MAVTENWMTLERSLCIKKQVLKYLAAKGKIVEIFFNILKK